MTNSQPPYDPEGHLASRAAFYIANHLVGMRYLVGTDPEGYELALRLAARSGPYTVQAIRDLLGPLVEDSVKVGQDPPHGW
jgi:hypothetical protein